MSPLRVFGAMLRHYRMKAGMSQKQLGGHLYCSDDLIGKIENGQRAPTEQFTTSCDALAELNTDGALTELRELLKDYLKERAFPGWFHDWPGNEAHAKTLRTFELVAVPGLLQTEDYARAMLRTQVMASEDETDEMVAARMDRQVILARPKPPMLWVLLDEGVLRRPVGGNGVMGEQIGHLIESAHRPNIVIQVIPTGVGAHQGMSGNFVVADFEDAPPVAYQDTAARGQIIEDADDIGAISLLWDTLNSEALPRSASVALMEEVAKTWT
ncbi:MAG TPA: helix-turn-helix transcriptional regulator [Streptosporangiaceae bacterium]|nr:helix-turn-helix transcriptional regulator [Streptosporangiaceae bacterium]